MFPDEIALPMQTVTQQIKEFIAFAAKLKGDEKGESQIFLDHLFRAPSATPASSKWGASWNTASAGTTPPNSPTSFGPSVP
jgi:hypothetical protein